MFMGQSLFYNIDARNGFSGTIILQCIKWPTIGQLIVQKQKLS
jgi:hypothetical protein